MAEHDDVFEQHANGAKRSESQADRLVKLAAECELIHTPDGTAYAAVTVGRHRETWPVRRSAFKGWLRRQYYLATGKAANAEALTAALGVLEARAQFDGVRRDVHLRVASFDDRLYVDLCDDEWRAVEIDRDGWRVVSAVPVLFRRTPGMLSLPVPKTGGDARALRRHINIRNDDDLELVLAWIQAALRDRGPFPLLVLAGEPGSAKSTTAKRVRALVDPHKSPLRTLPKDERDLWIAASNSAVLAVDNITYIKEWLSDALCRLATGGGFSTRELYSDSDELVIDAMRPTILTGIADVARRPDLADRSILLQLDPLPHGARPDAELEAQWRADRPGIFGAILDRLVDGLRHQDAVALNGLPRMADFARWTAACEYPETAGADAYRRNRATAVATIIDDDPVAVGITRLSRPWSGTAKELLTELEKLISESARGENWPTTAQAIRSRVRQVGPALRAIGIDIAQGKRTNKARPYTIADKVGFPSSPSSQAADSLGSAVTIGDDPGGDPTPTVTASSPLEAADSLGGDDRDDRDDRNPMKSGALLRVCGRLGLDLDHALDLLDGDDPDDHTEAALEHFLKHANGGSR